MSEKDPTQVKDLSLKKKSANFFSRKPFLIAHGFALRCQCRVRRWAGSVGSDLGTGPAGIDGKWPNPSPPAAWKSLQPCNSPASSQASCPFIKQNKAEFLSQIRLFTQSIKITSLRTLKLCLCIHVTKLLTTAQLHLIPPKSASQQGLHWHPASVHAIFILDIWIF